MSLTCAVVDDHPAIVRAVTASLAAEGFEVVGEARSVVTARRLIESARPAVAIVDLNLPDGSGLELAPFCAEQGTRVVLYTGDGDGSTVRDGLGAGVHGFVQKDAPMTALARAVDAAAAGRHYVDPALANAAMKATEPPVTEREREALALLAAGGSYDEIARDLSISAETVRTHIRSAVKKLGAANKTAAVAVALRGKLLE